ncbi:Cysteine desulfurase [Acetobacteraceae bacterium EV16G]|uniref:Cysteine desulfurase n=2 Tax=Sorlinia euscelidii TaxID=3081148 RepID=A0ABU7U3Q2_9PROT
MNLYFDANATEKPRPQAREAMLEAAMSIGNPASIHKAGREARRLLERSRTLLAESFDIIEDQLIFTSGGTEANALALHAFSHDRRILITATEHDSVRKAARAASVIPVMPSGEVSLEDLETMLRKGGPALVCAMAANNETGVINPLPDIAALCQTYGAYLHVDAVQYAARHVMTMRGLTSVAISGHKAGGLKGAGALLLSGDIPVKAMMSGGGQERGRRGGTPALPGIASMAAAMRAGQKQDWSQIAAWRDEIERVAQSCGALVVGKEATARLANTSCLILPEMSGQAQLIALDLAGCCVSTGSACSSGKVTRSHVLEAMGMGQLAGHAIRISLPWDVTEEDVAQFCMAYGQMASTRKKGVTA